MYCFVMVMTALICLVVEFTFNSFISLREIWYFQQTSSLFSSSKALEICFLGGALLSLFWSWTVCFFLCGRKGSRGTVETVFSSPVLVISRSPTHLFLGFYYSDTQNDEHVLHCFTVSALLDNISRLYFC